MNRGGSLRPSPRDARPPRAVIFDLDDTLVQSAVDFGKFRKLVIERIVDFGEDLDNYDTSELIVAIIGRFEENQRTSGVPESVIRSRLAELDVIMDQVEMERADQTIAIKGAVELLTMLKMRGVRIGILTRGCRQYAEDVLERTGLIEMVDELECRNSETRPKPSPDAYLRLVRALGIEKDETVFVGDHVIDAQCAKNAGVPFISVMTGDVPEDILREAGSIAVFEDVGHLIRWFDEFIKIEPK
ncbi:MAG: HAD family hydrolase [Candidatus Thermoplasmatota archaeon]|nr:HAD family hydrolase [Candidatus Thermoplasmatota archaeon]